MKILYFDTSAIIKLVRQERESQALRRWLAAPARTAAALVVSALSVTEVPRALRRIGPGMHLPDFGGTLDRFVLRAIDEPILRAAGAFPMSHLRSLDAIHLATAQSLFDAAPSAFETLITYDDRMAAVAATLGLPVATPS